MFRLLAEKMAENNHSVWIITNNIIGEKYENKKNINFVFIKPDLKYQGGLPPSIKNNFLYFINATKVGLKIIKENNIDLIHSNNFTPSFAGSFLSLLTAKRHITSVWDIFTLCGNDYWERWTNQENISKINQIIGPKFEKLVLKIRCNAIHTISDASKDDLVKFGAKKPIYMIVPAIEEIKNKESNKNIKQFIYVGRLVFYKNLEVIIKAIKIVKVHEEEIKLVIVGNGPHLKIIENMIRTLHLENNIVIKGYLDTNEKFQLISESNALLFPSLCEGFGLVILEAFSQKRPVLSSNIRPMSDIIEDQKAGYLIDPYDENAWAEKIIKIIKEPEISKKMGDEGYKILKEKYNQDVFYQNINKMYNDVLSK